MARPRANPSADGIVYVWHWIVCSKCGDSLHLRQDGMRPEAIGPRCCGVMTLVEPRLTHPAADALEQPLLCPTCGYEKEFGTPPTGGQEDDDMAKKKTTGQPTLPGTRESADVERDRYEEKLPCKISKEISTAKAEELAVLVHQRHDFLERRKAENAKARERRAFFDERIQELALEVDGKVEYRNVTIVEFLTPNNHIKVTRQDTGEISEMRAATAEELQEPIPGTGPARGAKKKKKASAPRPGDVTDPAGVLGEKD